MPSFDFSNPASICLLYLRSVLSCPLLLNPLPTYLHVHHKQCMHLELQAGHWNQSMMCHTLGDVSFAFVLILYMFVINAGFLMNYSFVHNLERKLPVRQTDWQCCVFTGNLKWKMNQSQKKVSVCSSAGVQADILTLTIFIVLFPD